jgi:NAD(P)-dependent dehydrogenase (short-subunit alcohol dehydrogenase family)
MRQAVIVGGTGGLGSALVRHLLDRNVQVVVAGRSKSSDDRVRSYVIDATGTDWRLLYSTIERDSGKPIDAVVFVAGTAAYGRTASVPAERERSIFELNFWACTHAARSAAEHWAKEERPGTFLAVLSIVARRAVPFEACYAASKAAAGRFLECLDLEYGPMGIRILSAYPGTLDTPFRGQAEWYGVAPAASGSGADVRQTAKAIFGLLDGTRRMRVIGWRERVIDLADRLVPGLYDRVVLRKRVARMLKEGAGDAESAGRASDENSGRAIRTMQAQGQR